MRIQSLFIALLFLAFFNGAGQAQPVKFGLWYLKRGKTQKAEQIFEKKLLNDNKNVLANYGMAWLHADSSFHSTNLYEAYNFSQKAIISFQQLSVKKQKKINTYLDDYPNVEELDNWVLFKLAKQLRHSREIDKIEKFLQEIPYSGFHAPLKKLRDSIAFSKIEKQPTITGLQNFIATYPDAAQIEKANTMLYQMRYKNALNANTIEAFKSFIRNNPQAPQIKLAKEKIEAIEFAKWKHFVGNYDSYYNHVAHYFAGMEIPDSSRLSSIRNNEVWKAHRDSFGSFYEQAYDIRIPAMKRFAATELSGLQKDVKNLLYPFSGPDFLHANVFFPNAEKIYMFGLERIGKVPDIEELSDKRQETFFKALKISMDSVFIWSYFMTNDMNKDFARSLELRGVIPVLMVFMAKSGYHVLDVKKVTINKNGKIVSSLPGRKDTDNPWDTYISGVRIKYVENRSYKIRELYYFSHDVSDKNLEKTPEFITFIESQPVDGAFFKAASYLCWYFTKIRNAVLAKADVILQTDSGIPLRYLNNSNWGLTFYGKYTRPIGVFRWTMQPELKKIYKTNKDIKPLKFGIGYGIRYKESNLMVAKRKNSD